MSGEISHNPDSLGAGIQGMDLAVSGLGVIRDRMDRMFNQIGSIIDGNADDELSQGVEKTWKMVGEISQSTTGGLGETLLKFTDGVTTAGALRDIAGENAATVGNWGAGTSGGKH
ncbi:hypothetical protein [Kineosporia succinea]|uniref:WXG100 family type VII secretion target n=1 Tax=Kineosporia succinea TaxID=84632 RepID=A0ABT9P523_9ACTN|nr:hypothetical protein [Kineosporia succinea]MDP9827778.1 hypothetical protein [Kineosporia succinea]